MDTADLRFFVRESNRIEGIRRAPLKRELQAHVTLLTTHDLAVMDLAKFVDAVQPGKELRIREGMNVRVGSHIAPPGGPAIGFGLKTLLDAANAGADPYVIHQRYEHLHPFMDGNGRSGRALWLWQMIRQHRNTLPLHMGFLHLWYYQSLSCWRAQPNPSQAALRGLRPRAALGGA